MENYEFSCRLSAFECQKLKELKVITQQVTNNGTIRYVLSNYKTSLEKIITLEKELKMKSDEIRRLNNNISNFKESFKHLID